MAVWLHQLTARTAGEDILAGHGVRGGKAMIATLRWRLIAASIGAALEAAAGAAAAGGLSARRAVGLGQRCAAGLQCLDHVRVAACLWLTGGGPRAVG